MPKRTDFDYLQEDVEKLQKDSVGRVEFDNLKRDVNELMDNRKWLVMTILGFVLLAMVSLVVRVK